MKISVKQPTLSAALKTVSGATSARHPLPTLSSVLLVAHRDRLEIESSNLDTAIRTSVEAYVHSGGRALIPFQKLSAIVSQIGSSDIEIAIDHGCKATISSGGASVSVSGLNPEEFPAPAFTPSETLVVSQASLRQMLKLVIYSASGDPTRHVFNSVLIHVDSEGLKLVATSGARLSRALEDGYNKKTDNIIVPIKSAKELFKLLGADGDVVIKASENAVVFDLGATTLWTPQLAEKYPSYSMVIPVDQSGRASINRTALVQAVKLCGSIVEPGELFDVQLKLSGQVAHVFIVGKNGSAESDVPLKYDGPGFLARLNADFLLEMLEAIPDEEITFEFETDLMPLVTKAKGFLGVMMCLRPK